MPNGRKYMGRDLDPLVLLRRSENTRSREDRFTGWMDVELTEEGFEAADRASLLRQRSFIAPGIKKTP